MKYYTIRDISPNERPCYLKSISPSTMHNYMDILITSHPKEAMLVPDYAIEYISKLWNETYPQTVLIAEHES